MFSVFRLLLPLIIAIVCQPCLAQVADAPGSAAKPQTQGSAAKQKSQGSAAKGSTTKTIDPIKKEDIRKMLVATGAGQMGVQVINQMIGMQRRQNPNVPKEFWDDFLSEIDANELIELTIPAYDKHLSHDEVKELTRFYESPVGKKLVQVQPQIMQDSMSAGQQWGAKLAQKIVERLKAEGYRP